MQTYRIETVVTQNRGLYIRYLPFRAGEKVEVIIMNHPRECENGECYHPLRGKAIRYVAPFDPVAENDWNSVR